MKAHEELVEAVQAYCKRHGITPKYTKSYPDQKYIYMEAPDFTTLEAKATGKKTVFKVDGKIASLKK